MITIKISNHAEVARKRNFFAKLVPESVLKPKVEQEVARIIQASLKAEEVIAQVSIQE